jgi:hypothetical protein
VVEATLEVSSPREALLTEDANDGVPCLAPKACHAEAAAAARVSGSIEETRPTDGFELEIESADSLSRLLRVRTLVFAVGVTDSLGFDMALEDERA